MDAHLFIVSMWISPDLAFLLLKFGLKAARL